MLVLGSSCAANLLDLPTGTGPCCLRRAKNEGLLVTVCSRCGQKTLEQLRLADGGVMHSVQHCTNCDTLWQRDANASRNIRLIAAALAYGQEYSVVYNRSPST
ncbi:uncharacterized protein BYT42DRAFT_349448 [Radiomyces spectabilis]|uniref:uncharacterized protein n=1 Tax=Radiomyces spectabilis TaxID=64574 RepID=UPI002220A43F|nr:uncharacterized protein BYT42DRAFT_349448 [Radiomyces spectabilis]KAI8377584.1 hypothetical protein BYT42DRAFT_349448 [Radiomyces spectabilis]